jgi:hypothetical protein
MKTLFIAAMSTLLPLPALAQEPAQQPACAPIAELEAKLGADYHESRVQQGIASDGKHMLVIFAAPDGATWTAIMLRPDGLACLAVSGENWQSRHDEAPVVEEGL